MKHGMFLALVLIAIVARESRPQEMTESPFSVRRFMLAAGMNDGGEDRPMLRYAVSDAASVARVFRELGGVESDDQVVLLQPDRAALWSGIQELNRRVAAAKAEHARIELFVYYSGHSNERGLLLGGESLSYRELREAVDGVDADVRVIILDSCASGALTRLKGGVRKPPFLLDESAQMKGHAFLTSSSEDEAAQESDGIEGSYFTHSLVSGLRGAADVTQDRRVTLNEAYQFAFYETMAHTEGTQSGTQHPAYDIQMVGAGDLVMTDLRGTSAGLIIDERMAGRIRVRDAENTLVVELNKPPGRPIELGLEPGSYRVILERDGEFFAADIDLPDESYTMLNPRQFASIASERTVIRGGPSSPAYAPPHSVMPEYELDRTDVSLSLWPGMSTISPNEDRTMAEISINLTIGRIGAVNGLELGYLGNWVLGDLTGGQAAGFINIVEGSVCGVQAAGVLNRVRGELRYGQLSGFVNSAGARVRGFQIASMANIIQGRADAAQASGALNLAMGRQRGIQVSGGANAVMDSLEGLQCAGFGNLVKRHASGAQIASTFNGADSFNGLQLSILNVAGMASGAQIGVINIARRVSGAQIGVINIAEDVSGAPIGLINVVRNGRQNIDFWWSDTAELNVGIKLGNQHIYSLLKIGWETFEETDRRFFGVGVGGHVPYRNLFATLDLLTSGIEEDGRHDEHHMLHEARLGFGWQIAPRLAVVGGGTVNVFTSRLHSGAGFARGTWYDEYIDDTWVKIWPGFFLGLQI